MHLDFLKAVFSEFIDEQAFVYRDHGYSYCWLTNKIEEVAVSLSEKGIYNGSVVALYGDFSPGCIATLLALCEHNSIIVPIAPTSNASADDFLRIAQAEFIISEHCPDEWQVSRLRPRTEHPLYDQLRTDEHPGLVLFSSGTTGDPKGATHDLTRLLSKYQVRRQRYRTLAFLLFDHIGGFDTLFYVLSNASTLVIAEERTPYGVCKTVERHRVEVLPVSPSFLNALIVSEAYLNYDLSSLKYVTYGAELMTQSTLDKCVRMFPGVELLQKYGTTEVGTLRSKSKNTNSLWVKVGGEGYQTRVVDGILQIKAVSTMLGYLNAESPFTPDGWFKTGDHVEVNGEYIRFLGRDSDIINVGGRKLYPGEVEAVIAEIENVVEVVVYSEPNPLLGNIVCAKVRTVTPEDPLGLERRIRKHCSGKLAHYKVPIKVQISEEALISNRFKLIRSTSVDSSTRHHKFMP